MGFSLLLGGCAAYQAYHEGEDRLQSGDTLGGVSKLREATELDPDDSRYRQAYVDERDKTVARLAREAQSALASDQFQRARDAYHTTLQLDPQNAAASEGLARVDQAEHDHALFERAEQLSKDGDLPGARSAVDAVLARDPTNGRALSLSRRLAQLEAESSGKEFGLYPKLKAAYRKPVSVTLTKATLLQAFETIKLASGLNFMFDKDVHTDARVTISTSNKPAEDIIRLLLASNQLEKRVLDEDTLLIYPNTQAKLADYRELVTRTFYLSYADIRQIQSLLKTVVKVKDVFIDEKLNTVIVRDSPEVIHLAEKLIANEDVPEPEVTLEMEVLEVSTTRLLQMGVQWPSSVSASVGTASSAGSGSGSSGSTITLADLHGPKAGLVSLTFNNPLASAELLEQATDSDLLANPRIRVRNRETAKILIGQRVPVVTTNAVANVGVAQAVSYLDVGLKLEIEPTISLDDEVNMKVALEVSSIQNQTTLPGGTIVYTLGTRNASTVLRVHDQETQILAGLIQRDEQNSNNGIPGLNDVPVINKLFGQGNNNSSRTEVVLLITPHIVRNVQLPGMERLEILSGTENSLGAPPIQLGRPSGAANVAPPPTTPSVQPPPTGSPAPIAPAHFNPATPTSPQGSAVPLPSGTPSVSAPPIQPPPVPSLTAPGIVPSSPGTLSVPVSNSTPSKPAT